MAPGIEIMSQIHCKDRDMLIAGDQCFSACIGRIVGLHSVRWQRLPARLQPAGGKSNLYPLLVLALLLLRSI